MRSWILVLATCQVAFCAGTAAAMPSDTADIVVKSVRLTGRQGEVLGVEMEFVGGDRSVMTITPARGGAKLPSQ